MYCNHCGSELSPGISMCPKCGKVVAGAWPETGRRSLSSHLSLLVVFWYVLGVLRVIPVIVMLALAGAAGAAMRASGSPLARVAGPGLFLMIAVICAIFAILSLLTAWGLQTRKPWGRTMALVTAIISLLSIPVGTALGIYTLVVLLPEPADSEYHQMAKAA